MMLSRTNLVKLSIGLISIGLWCINFFYVHKNEDLLFRIAKGFGLNLRCWTMFLYTTMCRNLLHGKIEKHVTYHKFIGYIMMICALGYSIVHIIYSRISDIQHITEYLLLSFYGLIAFGYLSRFMNSYIPWSYSLFKYTHYLYYVILPILIIHITKYWVWFAIPLIIFSFEIFLNLRNIQYSYVKNVDKQGDHMFISVPRVIDAVPGSYYYLCVPSLHKITIFGYEFSIPFLGFLEWHPFSLCSSSHINHLIFMIEAKGDWTKAFYNKVNSDVNETTLFVMGPFRTSSSLIMNADVEKKTIVCTGVDITPFLSVINTKIDEYQTNNNYRIDYNNTFTRDLEQQRGYSLISTERIFGNNYLSNFDFETMIEEQKQNNHIITYTSSSLDIHWTFRDIDKVKNFLSYIKRILNRSHNINLYIYITSNMNDEDKETFKKEHHSHGIKSICFCRLDLRVIDTYSKQIYFCGSPVLRKSVKDLCKKNEIQFFSEVF